MDNETPESLLVAINALDTEDSPWVAKTSENTSVEQKPAETQEKQVETNEEEDLTESKPEDTPESKEGEESEDSEAPKKDEQKPESRANKRIRELNEAKKLAESRAAQLEAQLRDIELRRQEIDKLAEGEMPDPNKFKRMDEYVDALTEAKVNASLKIAEQNRLKSEQERAETAYVQEIVGSFSQKVQIAAQANPDLPKAVEHLDKIAHHIPVEVKHALLTDENAAQLAWEIATNQELLDYVCKNNPINSIKVLAKISAKYDPADDAPAQTATPAVPANKPTAFTPTAKAAPKVPSVPKSGASGKTGIDGMSSKEYWRALNAGKVSKPWEGDW